MEMKKYDVAVIGAGASGMMCAALAGQRGRSVVLIEHAPKLAEKIRISGGGRCNFTNKVVHAENFISDNIHFCRSVLARYTPEDFLELVRRYKIKYHEKHKGQLFCDVSSELIIQLLKSECSLGNVAWEMPEKVKSIEKEKEGFILQTTNQPILAKNVVIATGGLSIPKIGASDFAYRVAQQFGIKMVPTYPALVPLTFDAATWAIYGELAGVALPVEISVGEKKQRITFKEDLLFTHKGLSGPAVLQISSYWKPGMALDIDLLPQEDLATTLIENKSFSRKNVVNVLSQWLPSRLVEVWLMHLEYRGDVKLSDMPDKKLHALAHALHHWKIVPSGTEGYRKAEVTGGGVDTAELHQQTMMSKKVDGLYFVGEAVDVTGWLGGYNFQWAWASGAAAGRSV
jgi:predicted Rossmann fold flavoprotein